MRISFDFLSAPVDSEENKVTVLCIENRALFRRVVSAFYTGNTEEESIIFSDNLTPFKYKGNVDFIYNYIDLNFSSALIKKLYTKLSEFSENEMLSETQKLNEAVFQYLDALNKNFDYDFDFDCTLNLPEFFKCQGLRPDIKGINYEENLIDYILAVQKYSPVKLFVLFTPHLYFDSATLHTIYKELLERNINVFVIEGVKFFDTSGIEKVIIVDKDLCEID